MSGYVLFPEAAADLEEIADVLAEKSQDRSDCVISQIHDAIRRLVPFPHQGHRRSDLTSKSLPFKRAADYLIEYAPEETPLLVVSIVHGGRSPRVMAAILRGRE